MTKKTTAAGINHNSYQSSMSSRRGTLLCYLFVCVFLPTDAGAVEEYIGIIQSGEAIGRAEAVTSNASPSTMSYYNPALLGRNDAIQLKLLGVEASADSRSIKDALSSNSTSNQSQSQSLEAFYKRINSTSEATSMAINITALDFAVPWFALQTFGSSNLSSSRVSDPTEDYYDASARLRAGGIFGTGVSFGKFSIGASQYYFSESSIRTTPKVSVSDAINTDIENETFSNSSAAFKDFTEIKYGHATGRNVGALVHWREDNPSAFGYSILNLGETTMQANSPSVASQVKNEESKMKNLATEYDIELKTPENLPELHNIGLTIGYGGNSKSIVKIAGSVDYHDIRGSYIKNKFTSSIEFGIDVPEDVATKYVVRFNTKTVSGWNIPMQVGVLKAKVVAGHRPGSYSSYGWETVFHGGTANLSVVLLTLQGNVQETHGNTTPKRKYGLKASIGLTLLY